MQERGSIVINRQTRDVISATAEFYTFIGKRLYHTLDQLVIPEDRRVLLQAIETCSGERFSLRMLAGDGSTLFCLASVHEGAAEQTADVSLIAVDELLGAADRLNHAISMKNRVLSLYNDEYFEYNACTDRLRIYSVNRYEQDVIQVTMEDFLGHLMKNAPDDCRADVEHFCDDFRSHKPTMTLLVNNSLLDPGRQVVLTLIRGVSLFESGMYTGAAGYIHFGNQRTNNEKRPLERDSLTGLMSKAEITRAAASIIDKQKLTDTSIAIIDVDHFKQTNDVFGHLAGDELLQKIATIIEDEVGTNGLVGRIGGDEFLVVLLRMADMENHRELLRSIKNRVAAAFPAGNSSKPFATLSIGCAAYPKDADSYEDLFRLADFAMYSAKHKGRNRYIIYDCEKHGSLEEIRQTRMGGNRLDNRGDMSTGDLICAMMTQVYTGHALPVDDLLDEAAMSLGLQRIMLFAGDPLRPVSTAGERRPDRRTLDDTLDYLNDPALNALFDQHGVLVCNDVERFAARNPVLYSHLKRLGVLSLVQIRGRDADGQNFVLSIESVSKRVTWNATHVQHYALFGRILGEYHLLA